MRAIQILLATLFSIAVAACGGGGGSSTPAASTVISGTAAAGAPVVGYVSVRDSSANIQPVKTNIPIEANGHYSIDVTGLTAPYAFLATGTVGGKTVSLYSAATSADEGKTINITPFTDLIIRNIAATAVDTYLSNPANMANLTTTQLDAQRVALTAQLAPALTAMGVSSSIDLLRATFNADSTGLDRFMDVVKVDTTTPSAVTITNILGAATTLIIDTTASSTTLASAGALDITGLAASGTPFDGILQTFNTFSSKFATSLPSPTDLALAALFTSTFMDNGQNVSAFLTDITTMGTSIIGLKFTNVVLDSIDATGTIAQVHFTPIIASGGKVETMGWQMKKDAASGIWQADGNRRLVWVGINAVAVKDTCNPANTACTTTTTYSTGLHLDINNNAMQPVGSVVVTGPSLPAGGVTLATQASQTWFNITTTNANNNPPCTGCTMGNNWLMTDAEIAAVLPNSVYTIKLYDLAGTTLLDTYTEIVPFAPVLNTAVAGLAYPSLSGMVNLNGISAATLTPSWSIPSGLSPSFLDVYVWQTATNANQHVEVNDSMTSSSGTASLVFTAPPSGGTWSGGGYTISARDQYGGEVNTRYNN